MEKLTPDELNILYGNFMVFRDKYCKGHATMNIKDFYKKFGLNEYKHPEDIINEWLGDSGYPYGTYGGY